MTVEPALLLIDAGGTIASIPDDHGVLVGREGSAGLSAALPPVPYRLTERQAYAGLSEDMGFADALRIADMVAAAEREGMMGVVVAHGTDTMEDVAFLLDLLHTGTLPVVFTGAQRAPSAAGSDGMANLLDALAVAAHPAARGIGSVIVFGGRILPAPYAMKLDSSGPEAFGPHSAAIGRVDEYGVRLELLPRRRAPFAPVTPDPAVEIVALGLGSDGRQVDLLVQAGVRGIVVQGFGRGNVPASVLPALERAKAAGVLLGLGTHCIGGGTAPSYASGAALERLGAVPAGLLSARKLRLLLAVALGDGRPAAEAERLARGWLAPVA
jgi:L-asparaginase